MTESANIPHGWLAEEAAVFAIELCGTLVADFKSRAGGIKTILRKHANGLSTACVTGNRSNYRSVICRRHKVRKY